MSFRGQLIKAGIDSNGTDIAIFNGTLTLQTDNKLIFRDSGIYIHSNADGYLTIEADAGVVIASDLTITGTVTYTGTFGVTGDLNVGGTLTVDGVTTGISVSTAATGITFSGAYTTAAIQVGTDASKLTMAAYNDYAIDINTTCAVASNSGTPINAFHLKSTTTGTQSEDWAMSVHSYTDIYSGNENTVGHFYSEWGTTSGIGPLGMASAVTAKMLLPTMMTGAFFPFYSKINLPTNPNIVDPSAPGNSTGFMMLSIGGETAGKNQFDDYGLFMEIHNLTAGAGHLLSANSQTLKCALPAAGTINYLMLSNAEDRLKLSGAILECPVDLGSVTASAYSNIVLGGSGRISTSTSAGAALDIGATCTRSQGMYLRYSISDWTGKSNFFAAYLRAETGASAAGKELNGIEVYATAGHACGQLRAIQSYAYVKTGSTSVTIGPIYGVSAELTFDAGTGTKTITTEAMPLRVKITGGKVDTYTKIHGIQLKAGDMNGASPTYGSAIWVLDDAGMTGTVAWTTGFNLAANCTTAINISGTCTTGINLSGCTGAGSNIILGGYGRISTSTYAGAALDLDASFTQNEGLYLRYSISSWTGIGSSFYGAWIRAQTGASAAGKSLTGAEIYGTAEHACGELRALQTYAYLKGTGAKTVGPVYAVSAELTCDASQSTQTITTEAMCLRCKITGGNFNTDTLVHGIQIKSGDMDGGSPAYGNAIHILDDAGMTGTTTWTTGINIAIGCADGILISGAMSDNALEITSACVTGNSILITSTISGAAALDVMKMTVTDSIAIASTSYSRGLYIAYTNSGVKSANAECNGIGIDMDSSANVTSMYGASFYTGACSGATINRLACIYTYMDTATGTVGASNCVRLEHAGGGTYNSFISLRKQGGTINAMIETVGGGGSPVSTYLFEFEGTQAPCETFASAGNGDYSIKCRINGEVTYIHTYDAP